ncbi:hypothetical protein [Xanthobacter tagetidis]|uniref:Uncharacterized protein n=1 Tax=Xanthobacter tagetidis TaxID=60216 RepID=A0A3L7AIX7_9HYPH|nr:hypothetical protein [Xanthobacter tagetidis]MBB6306266.1 hypothetical protein [Xanthobacter tagetidis]RLP79541.1 hypothetical protein D9R14_07715 [Xanthobacter tagetidis]
MAYFAERVALMARELTKHTAVDLGDEAAVMRHLQSAGFGPGEITAGLDEAIDTARADRVSERILYGLPEAEHQAAG